MNVDWQNPTWSYLLGVVHGDGTVATRSISICVGYRDQPYADMLQGLWRELGFDPKEYRARTALRIDVHSKALRDAFAPYKADGRWSFPPSLATADYLAGVFDTDGCVSRPELKHVSIGLKESGNLNTILRYLEELGICGLRVAHGMSSFKGKKYPRESIKITGMDRMIRFGSLVPLRNGRKAERMREMLHHIQQLRAHVPLWREVALWLQEAPRSWKDIAAKFGLNKDQVDSVLQNIKASCEVEVVPPPEVLTMYRVRQIRG